MKTLFLTLALLAAMPAISQAAEKSRKSPHETVSSTVDGDKIKIVYGRPYMKDPKTGQPRKIWGTLVPFDEVWRTGADEATLFTTQKAIMIGKTTVPAGTYSLYTWPAKDGSAKLIVNKEVGQWGTKYDEKQDLVRVDLKKMHLDHPADQFTMAVDKDKSGGMLKMAWDDTQFAVPFTVATSDK